MHELGIVIHVVKQVEELVKKNNATKAVEVTLEVGEVSGVVKEYFVDAFNWAANRSEYMKECKLNYIVIQAITYCEDCKHTYPTVKYGKECPFCHSPNTYLTTGRDVMIKDIKVL